MTARICARSECERAVVGRGLCRMHYLQEWRAGTVSERPVRTSDRNECPTDGEHQHTHDGCWANHGCRCNSCTHSRRMERQRRRNRLRAYGQVEKISAPKVNAGPAREHLAELIEDGIGLERIADAAGIPRSVALDLRFGRRGERAQTYGVEVKQIKAEYAEALLKLSADDVARAVLPATGTVRRLRALVAIGWTQTELSDGLGMQRGNFSRLILGTRDRVTAATAERTSEMFSAMWDGTRAGTYADLARAIAKRRGWVGPLGWDDIDSDPEPAVVEQSEQTKGERFLEDVEWLLDAGEPAEQIARTLGRKVEAIEKLAHRHGRPDLARPFAATAQRGRRAA